ncbi:unnamed protein product [Urochloa decumbens]|uniref:AP2/ERF domain-containing protein n=1 Tax=Urochloa decumbens TaxID=240449 RepID=A0ABC9BFJ6_9POAL
MAKRPRNAAADGDSGGGAGTGVRGKPAAAAKRARRKGAPRESPSQRSSAYRGVTRHRWTGRFEAHLWDKDARSGSRGKKGKQVYLGAYDDEDAAARAHDLAALKYWGPGTVLNFPLCGYDEELKEMEGQPREEYIGSLRRRSSGFSRGVSKYRGVARHHHNGRWEARIGRVLGNKYLYLGTYATQEEAAVAYDMAAIEHRGLNAVTNFDVGHYVNHWHRHCHGTTGDDSLGGAMAAAAPAVTFQLEDDLPELPAGDTTAAAGLNDGEDHHRQHQAAACPFLGDGVAQFPDQVGPASHRTAPTPSALDLLLQSPKFKEMMEQVSAAAAMADSDSSSPPASATSSASLSSPSPQPPLSPQGRAEIGDTPALCGFPDDVQTFFDFENEDAMGFTFAEVDTFLFGDLGEYAAPMFQYCDLDV